MGRIRRILIANRGEISARIARSCRELGIESVAVCSEADRNALHVRAADDFRLVGPARAQSSYLDVERILEAIRDSGADAVHPGYGFMAENADFARTVMEAGLVWIGPSPDSITAMGDKARALDIARAAGVPVLPGSGRVAGDAALDTLPAEAEKIGYPLLVKASAGGGGIGMKRVDAPEDLAKAVQSTQGLARANFGDATIFLEKFIPRSRHIEVQILGYGDGRATHLYERECSIQRRYQKIIEEAPSGAISADVRRQMTQAAVSLAQAQNYSGAGTVEFIVDDETGAFYFLEMNTRIQVEHPVTEMVTGQDLVAHQIRVAAGEAAHLAQDEVGVNGHAIELRIYAEDPFNNFMPQPGKLEEFDFPLDDASFRLDAGYAKGDTVPPYYDPLLAKLIVHGSDRDDAIDKSIHALRAARVSGIRANIPFLLNVMSHDAFRRGETLTSFIPDHEAELLRSE